MKIIRVWAKTAAANTHMTAITQSSTSNSTQTLHSAGIPAGVVVVTTTGGVAVVLIAVVSIVVLEVVSMLVVLIGVVVSKLSVVGKSPEPSKPLFKLVKMYGNSYNKKW